MNDDKRQLTNFEIFTIVFGFIVICLALKLAWYWLVAKVVLG